MGALRPGKISSRRSMLVIFWYVEGCKNHSNCLKQNHRQVHQTKPTGQNVWNYFQKLDKRQHRTMIPKRREITRGAIPLLGFSPQGIFIRPWHRDKGEKDQIWKKLRQQEFEGQSTIEEEKELQKFAEGIHRHFWILSYTLIE